MTTKFPIKIPSPLHILIALLWCGGFKSFTFIVNNLIQYELRQHLYEHDFHNVIIIYELYVFNNLIFYKYVYN
jgi:hypothetical protein